MTELTSNQKNSFLKYLKDYLDWNKTQEGKQNTKDHRDHQEYFQKTLSKEALHKLKEDNFRKVYKTLWASNTWRNKDWYIDNRLLKPNKDLEFIKEKLSDLFYSENIPLSDRYNAFKRQVRGLGSSALTELLHFVFPNKYCLWNDKPKTVLPFLNLDDLLPENIFNYQISDGKDYTLCNEVMRLLKKELVTRGIKEADFIDLDCYIWFIFLKKIPQRKRGRTPKEKPKKAEEKRIKGAIRIESHSDAEYYLLKLGEMLGYITYTADKSAKSNDTKLGGIAIAAELPSFASERDINSAREIDVIWLGEDENPKYCFEVEHTMDILRSLNRLYQLQHFNVNFLIVAPSDRKNKFDIEMSKFPFRNTKNRFRFISYSELGALYENGAPFFQLKSKLFGE